MSAGSEDRAKAAQLPDGDVIRILLEQHGRIRDLFAEVESSTGDAKQHAFDDLRALLAVHETAEEMIVRPVTRETAGDAVADARNSEEDEATHVLADLEKMDVNSAEFASKLAQFKTSVVTHAEREEQQEFPDIISGRDEQQRQKMGTALRAAEKVAPTHPHPSAAGSTAAQYAMGPFASLVDKARDALKSATS